MDGCGAWCITAFQLNRYQMISWVWAPGIATMMQYVSLWIEAKKTSSHNLKTGRNYVCWLPDNLWHFDCHYVIIISIISSLEYNPHMFAVASLFILRFQNEWWTWGEAVNDVINFNEALIESIKFIAFLCDLFNWSLIVLAWTETPSD